MTETPQERADDETTDDGEPTETLEMHDNGDVAAGDAEQPTSDEQGGAQDDGSEPVSADESDDDDEPKGESDGE